MSSAERVIAWNEVLTAAGLDPHAVPDDVKRVIHTAVMRYAKASGWREPTAAPQRVASGERSAVAGDGFTFRFGTAKGKTPGEVDVRDLRFYEKVAREALDNPEKERWRDSNQRDLDVIRAELRQRGEAADHD
jgi:hypothetical protein